MSINKFLRRENGDTIVEVLISLAILAVVLGGAYYTANQSYRNDRASQEHSEALTIAQSQIEDLQVYGDAYTSSTSPASNDDVCLYYSISSKTITVIQAGVSPIVTTCYIGYDNTTVAYPSLSTCLADKTKPPYCYKVNITGPTPTTITSNGINTTVNTYQAKVTWSALGGGTDDVSLYDRVDGGS